MVVQVSRLQDGSRKIINISEVVGIAHDHIEVRDIFRFRRIGVTAEGKVQGRFEWSGETPAILERLRISGIALPPNIFDEAQDVNL
jgi:pilus assembly protein CpaF